MNNRLSNFIQAREGYRASNMYNHERSGERAVRAFRGRSQGQRWRQRCNEPLIFKRVLSNDLKTVPASPRVNSERIPRLEPSKLSLTVPSIAKTTSSFRISRLEANSIFESNSLYALTPRNKAGPEDRCNRWKSDEIFVGLRDIENT